MIPGRWERLAADLTAAGIPATVHTRRDVNGTSHRVTIRRDAWLIEIRDRWWRKNADVWVGWVVWREGADAIVREDTRPTKRRADVVAAVRNMIERAAA